MRKIKSPLLVFALTDVNEDLISLIIWKETETEYCGIRTPNSKMGICSTLVELKIADR